MRGRLVLLTVLAAGPVPAAAPPPDAASPPTVRIATFNASLNRASAGELLRDLSTPDNAQARAVAEIIQRVRPDILLLQEFDYDDAGASLAAFKANYLGRAQNNQAPLDFPYTFFTESNTGIPSGFDLDHDGRVAGGGDALGFGEFPGQYAMVLLSRFPIDAARVRTFRKFLWRDMPGALLPDDPGTPAAADWYSPQELAVLPLSSKNHWDVPVKIDTRTVHLLISHPTPPSFDGPEDRNGRRNHDEVSFWRDYITRGANGYIRDDRGRRGGLGDDAFLIMGDLNSDPVDGGSLHDAIAELLAHPRIAAIPAPQSAGALEASSLQAGANAAQRGDARNDTADFNDRSPGNLRADYLLPAKTLRVCGAGVFWPLKSDPLSKLVDGEGSSPPSSDHRLVWLDISPGAARCPPGSDPTTSASSHPGH